MALLYIKEAAVIFTDKNMPGFCLHKWIDKNQACSYLFLN